MEFFLIIFGVILLIIGIFLSRKEKSEKKKNAPVSADEEMFLAMLRQEAMAKKDGQVPVETTQKPVITEPVPVEKISALETVIVQEKPLPPADIVPAEKEIKEDTDLNTYKSGTLGAKISEITKKADLSSVKIDVSDSTDALSITDEQLISIASIMLKRAVTSCEKGENKKIEFSARKSASDIVLSCKFPNIHNKAINESRAILKFSAEKLKGVFMFSDNGSTISEQAIIPLISVKLR